MSLSTAGKARLKREFLLLQKDPPPGVQASPDDINTTGICQDPTPTKLTHWTASIEGPRDSPFAKVRFQVKLHFPPRYPMEPPSAQFVGHLIPYHPNIDAQGRICLDTLKRPPAGSWSPAVSLTTLLLSLQLLLGEPNAEDGLEPQVTQLYQASREEWYREAKRRIQAAILPTTTQQQLEQQQIDEASSNLTAATGLVGDRKRCQNHHSAQKSQQKKLTASKRAKK